MKNSSLLLLFSIQTFVANGCAHSLLSEALSEIGRELRESVFCVTFLNFDDDKNTDIDIKRFSDQGIVLNIVTQEASKVTLLSDSGILLFKDVESFKTFYEKVFLARNPRAYAGPQIYYVSISEASMSDLLLKVADYRLIELFYFIVEGEGSFRLLTANWYSSTACNKFHLTVVNTFLKATRRWTSNKFKIGKFDNFHGCRLRVNAGSISYTHEKTMTISSELQIKIIKDLTRKLNFSLSIDFDNNTPVDMQISTLATLQSIGKNIFDRSLSQPFVFRDSLIAVPVGEEYNGFEKLLLPFDKFVWFWIGLTFCIAFATIFCVALAKSKIRNFIIGREIRAPALNVLMIFSGASQVKMPTKNFARFLVMSFVIYSLIIRTAWQGKMFEFMQKEIRKTEVQSIDDMTSRNFTFFVNINFWVSSTFFWIDTPHR